MQTKEQHEATTYRRTWLYGIHYIKYDFLPQNCVSATPFKLFGFWEGFKLILAKPDYPWACSCDYGSLAACKAKLHGDDYWKSQ